VFPIHNVLHTKNDNSVVVRPPVKINLALHVIGYRVDGYHLLESLVTFSPDGDVVRIALSDYDDLSVDGPFSNILRNNDSNLVLQARDVFRTAANCKIGPVSIYLTKNLPISSGVGGGSGDAAAVLIGLATLVPTGLRIEDLMRCARAIGADVPMCLAGLVHKSALIAYGIGDKIKILTDFPSLHLVLFHPGPAVATPLVFASLENKKNPPLFFKRDDIVSFDRLVDALRQTRNDLYTVSRRLAPMLDEGLEILQKSGAVLVRMSGSGTMCFGLYSSAEKAQRAAK